MKLSVILCNYNHAAFVERAITAMATQSHPPDELIIVDDGSQDGSWPIIERCAARFPCILAMRNESNQGLHRSWARGFGHATGDYLYSAAADDYIFPGVFASALDMACAFPEAGAVFGKVVAVGLDGKRIEEIGVSRWTSARYATPDECLREYFDVELPNHSLCGATVFRRACLEEVGGFRAELGSWCDTFAFRAICLRHGACYVPDPWLCWRVAPDTMSGRTARDTRHLLDLISRATRLMRSPEFADRFPSDHVAAWQSSYCALIRGGQPPGLKQRMLGKVKSMLKHVARTRR